MEEFKVKFSIQDHGLIRQGLAGIYYLLHRDEIVFIGEDKYISRQVQKHIKKGSIQFDAIGITPIKNQKKRRTLTKALINRHQPKFNKIKKHKSTPPKGHDKPPSEPPKKVSQPKSKKEAIQVPSQNGSVILSQPTADMVQWLRDRGLGTDTDIIQEAVERLYHEKIEAEEDTQPTFITNDQDLLEESEPTIISDEARDALIAWTQKLNQEAFSEMEITPTEAQPAQATEHDQLDPLDFLAQLDTEASADQVQQEEEDSSDLPEWLTNLTDETLFGDIPIEQNNLEQIGNNAFSQASVNESLPDWATESIQPTLESPHGSSPIPTEPNQPTPDWEMASTPQGSQTPAFNALNLDEDDQKLPSWETEATSPQNQLPTETPPKKEAAEQEIPDWLSDIDISKPRGKSASPFT